MKKFTYLLAIAAIFTFTTAQAQFEITRVGLKVGGQITNFSGDDAETFELDSKVGIQGGFFATFKNNDIGLQPEILISHKGANFEATNSNFRLWYIEVPLLFKYYVHDKFNVQGGPQFGYLFYAEFAGDGVDDQFKNLDVGLIGGLEFEAAENFAAGIRYNLGLTAIGEESTFVGPSGVSEKRAATDYKNTAIQIYLSLGI